MTAAAAHRARCLLVLTSLVDETLPEFACEVRVVARDLLDALAELESERSARAAITADRDRWRDNRWRETHGEPWPA